MYCNLRTTLIILVCAIFASPANAHVGGDHVHSFLSGFVHPISGLDHLLAMVAVGALAAKMGGRSFWLLPVSFMAAMMVGGSFGWRHVDVPYVELGIASSLFVFGAMLAAKHLPARAVVFATVSAFGLFHGYTHGAEMSANLGAGDYAAGFLTSTSMLHLIGILGALGLSQVLRGQTFSRIGGGALSVVGLGLMTGIV